MKWKTGNMTKQVKALAIEWDINEKERFKELIINIKNRSESLSQSIKNEVKQNLILIQKSPKIFEADNLKSDNDDSYRKFTVKYVRIVYKIESNKIIIARVRHSSSEPAEY